MYEKFEVMVNVKNTLNDFEDCDSIQAEKRGTEVTVIYYSYKHHKGSKFENTCSSSKANQTTISA